MDHLSVGAPFVSPQVRKRLWEQARNIDDLIAAEDREGEREARRITAMGVTLARAAGWDAEPLLQRTYAAEGTAIAQTAEKLDADVVMVASRGLGGTDAVLGSVSDMVVHYCSRPVIVVPHPLLSAEYDALPDGPVVVGWDGSAGAEAALATAGRLFPGRRIVAVSVDDAAEVPSPPGSERAAGSPTSTSAAAAAVRPARPPPRSSRRPTTTGPPWSSSAQRAFRRPGDRSGQRRDGHAAPQPPSGHGRAERIPAARRVVSAGRIAAGLTSPSCPYPLFHPDDQTGTRWLCEAARLPVI